MSGDECAAALAVAGWSIVERTQHENRLLHAGELLIVPRVALLDPDALLAVLKQAGVRPARFVDALARVALKEPGEGTERAAERWTDGSSKAPGWGGERQKAVRRPTSAR